MVEGDFHCSERIIRMMVRDSFEDGNDRLFLEYYTMDDIDIPSLEKYRIQFRIDNNGHVWNNLNHKDFLTQLGGYTINKEEGKEGLTMAGLLMFGKGLPIRERFDTIRMDYIDKSNLIGDQRYSDRLTYDGTWENNLYNFISMVIPRITRDLPRPFHMEGIIRQDDTLQHKAVREAVTNMIIHADFMMNGLLRVEKYDDRLEFTNPGLLKLPLDKIYAGGESKARNIRIQKMLRMIGFGESIGSGFPLILSAWDEKKWSKPELIEELELMQVKLVLNMKVTKDITKDITKELSERQKVILGYIKENKTITIQEMSQKAQVTTRTIKRDIEELIKKGLLLRNGGRKNGFWVFSQEEDSTKMSPKDVVKELSERQKVILGYIKENKTITIQEMSLKAQVTTRTIKRDIEELIKKGLLLRNGGRKNGFWVFSQEEDSTKMSPKMSEKS